MVRVIAFVAGVAAGIALLLVVIASMSSSTAASSSAPGVVSAQQGSGNVYVRPSDPDGLPSLGDDDDPDDGSQVDLQGDYVTPAIANYRFDAQGNIYETHAPHTEVPHLGSPQL